MKDEIIIYGDYEIEQSKSFMLSLCDGMELKEREKYCDIIHENFGEKIDLKKTLRGNFYNCYFHKTSFDDFDCSDYYFSSCEFDACKAQNSNFTYLGIINSSLQNNILVNTSFGYSILENVKVNDISIQACNFQNTLIKDCSIINANIECGDFAGAIITNSKIDNVCFSDSNIQYVEFNNVTCQNVSFLIEDILHCFNGIKLIQKNSKAVKLKLFDTTKEISGETFINSLKLMVPYLYSIHDYFSLANISLYSGETHKAFQYIMLGLKYNLEQRDFKVIHYLCKLAASNPLFSYNDLKSLYRVLESTVISSQLTRFEYRRYINEMIAIKQILIENPSSLVQMNVSIKTSIYEYDYEKLMKFVETIDLVANDTIPQTIKSVSIRHNSSPIIDIFLNGEWTTLIPFFALLCTVLGGSIKYIKQIYDLLITNETLKEKKLENKLKAYECEKQKLDIEYKKQQIEKNELEKHMLIKNLNKAQQDYKSGIYGQRIHNDETQNISYTIKADMTNIPIDARQMSFSFNVNNVINS